MSFKSFCRRILLAGDHSPPRRALEAASGVAPWSALAQTRPPAALRRAVEFACEHLEARRLLAGSPTVAITSPMYSFIADGNVTLGGTATDSPSGDGIAEVQVDLLQASTGKFFDGSSFSSTTPVWLTASGTTSWSYGFSGLANGLYTEAAQAIDNGGNTTTTISSFSFTVQTALQDNPANTMLLEPDGTVMVSTITAQQTWSDVWYTLTPNNGSYATGTLATAASMSAARLWFASDVLNDGGLFVVGGEYVDPSTNTADNTPELYTPSSGWQTGPTWTGSTAYLADSMSELLSDGSVLVQGAYGSKNLIYSPATGQWSTGPAPLNGINYEEGWVKLADGSLLTVDLDGSSTQNAERFIPGSTPGQGEWISAGTITDGTGQPVMLKAWNGGNYEIGPGILLPDGRVFWIGATGHTALYTPPTTLLGTGSWQQGPDLPSQSPGGPLWVGADTPAAVEPDGKVLFAAAVDATGRTHGVKLLEYTPDAGGGPGTIVDVTPGGGDFYLYPDYTNMLALPTGQTLVEIGGNLLLYPLNDSQPSGPSSDAATPVIGGLVPTDQHSPLQLIGTGLNGDSEGASFGDDAQMASNYPVVGLLDSSGGLSFGQNASFDSTGVQTGAAPVSTTFSDPDVGAYLASVSASGIPSATALVIDMGVSNDLNLSNVTLSQSGSTVQVTSGSYSATYYLSDFGQIIIAANTYSWAGSRLSDDLTITGDFTGHSISVDTQLGADADGVTLSASGGLSSLVDNSNPTTPLLAYTTSEVSQLLIARDALGGGLTVGGGAAPSGGITYDLQLPTGAASNATLIASGGQTTLVSGSSTLATFTTTAVNKLMIMGGTEDDTLTLDPSGGDPLPAGGLSFDGGTGESTLKVRVMNNDVSAADGPSFDFDGTPVSYNAQLVEIDLDESANTAALTAQVDPSSLGEGQILSGSTVLAEYSLTSIVHVVITRSADGGDLIDNTANGDPIPSAGIDYQVPMGDAGSSLTVQPDPSDSTRSQLVDGSTVLSDYPNAPRFRLVVVGGAGNDVLTVNGTVTNPVSSGGASNPDVMGGLSFDGGGGANSLVIEGFASASNVESFVMTPAGPAVESNGGSVVYSNTAVTITGGSGIDTLNVDASVTPDPVFSGGSGSNIINVKSGAFEPSGDVGSPGENLTINDYSVLIFPAGVPRQDVASLYIAPGGIASMAITSAPDVDVLYLRSLYIDHNSTLRGTLDLGNGSMLLAYGSGADPMYSSDSARSIFGMLASGYNSGAWNGHGIASSVAAANPYERTGIGYADSADGLIPGQPANTIELQYALYGDTNLDGTVTFDDFTRLTQHYNQTSGGTCDTGDFSYDGSVNFTDYTLMSRAYGLSIDFSLAPQSTFGVGSSPRDFATADVNHDGIPDLIVADYWDGNVDVLLGNGNGTFQAPASFATDTFGSLSVAAADLNADGNVDLIVGNTGIGSVSILLGNGNGTFQAAQNIYAGGSPTDVVVADVNGDGKPDLIVANDTVPMYGGGVNVLLGNGNGTFQSPQHVYSARYVTGVAVADLNGDGKEDIAFTDSSNNTVYIMLGNGNGTFQNATSYATGSNPWSIQAADLNGDGSEDLVISNHSASSVTILLGNGNGTFQSGQTVGVGSGPRDAVAADLNGDGIDDLIVSNQSDGTIGVLLGNGNGTFQAMQTFAVGNSPWGLQVVDVNGDGKPDIVVVDLGINSVSILLNSSGE